MDSSDCHTDVEITDDDLCNTNDIKEDQRVVSYQEIEGSVQTQSFSVNSNWSENMDQTTLIEKLKKEKKQLQENLSRYNTFFSAYDLFNFPRCIEEVQSYEMKANNLNNVRSKLESTLDDLEDELQMEKKSKILLDKAKRKLDGDLKRCLEVVEEKEKENNTIKQSLARREKELSHTIAKLEDEQTLIIKYVKQIKELGGRVEELEEDLETERMTKIKLENQRNALNQELEDLSEKLRDFQITSDQQTETMKRKNHEFQKLRKEMEEEHKINEVQMEAAKRNYHANYMEGAERLQNMELINQRLMKEKQELSADNDTLKEIIAEKDRVIATADKKYKSLYTNHQVLSLSFIKINIVQLCTLGHRK